MRKYDFQKIELIREIDEHPEKITATPIIEETEYGDRIIGWEYEIIIMNVGMVVDNE